MRTKKIFSLLLLCLLFYACAGTQTNPEPVQSKTTVNEKDVRSDFVVSDPEQSSKEQATRVDKGNRESVAAVLYLYIVKETKMRKEARNSGKVIATLKKGELVEKISDSKHWVKVKSAAGQTGWVLKKMVFESK